MYVQLEAIAGGADIIGAVRVWKSELPSCVSEHFLATPNS